MIVDLDHPYNGVSNIGPRDMRQVAATSVQNYGELCGSAQITACGSGGEVTG